VLANDTDSSRHSGQFQPFNVTTADQGGSVVVSNGKVLYTPTQGYSVRILISKVSYRVEDDSLGTVTGSVAVSVHQAGSDRDTALLQITVVGVNDPPVISGTVAGQTVYQKSAIKLCRCDHHQVDHEGSPLPGSPQPLTVTVSLMALMVSLPLCRAASRRSVRSVRATGIPDSDG
jgi:hypothetical protein